MIRHIRTLLSASRALAGPVVHIGIMRSVLLFAFLCVAAYYLFPRPQSFTIVAATQSVTVTTAEGMQDVWALENAVLCQRRPVDAPLPDELPQAGQCDPEDYVEMRAPFAEILWTPGYRLTVSGDSESQLYVSITAPPKGPLALFGEAPITNASALFFDRSSLANLGGLVAQGQIEIGGLAQAGAAKLTRSGTYQIRETLGLPSRKAVVATGDILTGDLVRLTDRQGAGITATMLLAPSADALADFDVIMTSPEQPSAIEITRIGGAQSTITTRWTDRIANDALPVALSIFLGLFGVTLGIARSLVPDPKPPAK